MDVIIKISTLYGISFLIAMFVAFLIWALYAIVNNPKFFSWLKGNTPKPNVLIEKTSEKVD